MGKYGLIETSYVDESAFAENSNSFSGGKRIPATDVRANLPSGRSTDGSIQTSSFEHRPGYLMSRSGGSLEIDFEMPGANVNTESGALDATHWVYKLLKDGLGGGNAAAVGGALNGVPTTTSFPYGSGTPVSGVIMRMGQKLDTKGDGQAFVVNAVGSPMTSFVALDAAPASGDKYRACLMAYPTETLGTTKRWLIGHADGGTLVARGCQFETMTLRSNHGETLRATVRYLVAHWDEPTLSIPQVSTIEDCKAHIMAGGSHVLQTVGTTTRAEKDASEMEITLGFQLSPQFGMGVHDLQHIIGWDRLPGAAIELRLTEPFVEGTAQTDYDSDGSDTIHKYYLGTMSAGDGTTKGEGRHFSIFMPRLLPIRERPRPRSWNGLNYMDRFYQARLGTDTTNDLTKSPVRFGWS